MVGSMSPEVIADRISLAIREKVLQPGSPLVQEDLARRFNVSRSPVREALRILATTGEVTMTPGGGATVRMLVASDLQELYDLRLMLEPTIAAPVVVGATPGDVARLRTLADGMADETDTTNWMRANVQFHEQLYALAGRPHTEGILRGLLSAVQPYSQENIERLGGRTQADSEHHRMVEAIAAGDADGFAELIRVHLASARDRVSSARVDARDDDPLAPLR